MNVNDTYGFWKVVEIGRYQNRPGAKVRCKCGTEKWHIKKNLTNGNTSRCRECSYKDRGPLFAKRITGDHLAAKDKFYDYKVKAKQRGIEFDLSFDLFYIEVTKPCFYCQALSSNTNRLPEKDWADDFVYTGLDRLENKHGYVSWNIVPCCWKCNYMKRDLKYQDFFDHCAKIVEAWPGKSAIAIAGSR